MRLKQAGIVPFTRLLFIIKVIVGPTESKTFLSRCAGRVSKWLI